MGRSCPISKDRGSSSPLSLAPGVDFLCSARAHSLLTAPLIFYHSHLYYSNCPAKKGNTFFFSPTDSRPFGPGQGADAFLWNVVPLFVQQRRTFMRFRRPSRRRVLAQVLNFFEEDLSPQEFWKRLRTQRRRTNKHTGSRRRGNRVVRCRVTIPQSIA